MAYVCDAIDVINGIQTCVSWSTYAPFFPVLSVADIAAISRKLVNVAGLFVAYAILAKAIKTL